MSDIADALRWFWIACGILWIVYAWLYRIPYPRGLSGVITLFVLDWIVHAFADFAEQPNSSIPSDFSLYSVMMLLAAIVGLTAACLYARWRRMKVLLVLDAALVCVAAAGIGGRAYHVLMNWNYYGETAIGGLQENMDLIADLSHGGFGIRGAMIFGFLALFLFAMLTRNSFWKFADSAVIGLALAQSIGWYGAALTYAHYGITFDSALPSGIFSALAQSVRAFGFNFVQPLPDAYNLIAFRIPVQILYALFFAALFFVLLELARRNSNRAGYVFTCYLLFVSLCNFLFGFWRGDETLMWNGLRVDQWVDLAMFVFGASLSVWMRSSSRIARIPRRSSPAPLS